MTVRIHIGAHKTATTELQRALRTVRRQLEAGGTPFVGPSALRGRWISLPNALFRDDPELRGQAERRLRRWLRRHQNHVMSEENILGSVHRRRIFGDGNRLYPEAADNVTRLCALMGGPEAELFLSIRDPAEFVTSAYGQVLREGVAMGIEDYVEGYDVSSFSWAELVGRLTECDGVTGVTCWRYEDYAELRPRILSLLVGEELAEVVPAAESHNMGISAAAYDQFMAWILDDMDEPFTDLLARARAKHPKTAGDPGMRPLAPEVYARSRSSYPGDVAALQALPGVTLLLPESGADSDKPA